MLDRESDPPPRKGLQLWQIAVIATLLGIVIHGCIFFAVIEDGDGGSLESLPTVAPTVARPAAATSVPALADRTNCNEIRNTEYRSETERQWFLANCRAPIAPTPVP